jgi:hypothetical protein
MVFNQLHSAIVADIVILYFRVVLFNQVDVLRYGFIVGTCWYEHSVDSLAILFIG